MNVYELLIIAVIAVLVINAIVFLVRSRRNGPGCSAPNVIIEDDSKKE